MCMTPCMVRLAISAAHSSSSRYSEVKGSASKSGPDGASRRSAGNRSRSVGTLEPRPASGSSQPSSSPSFHRIAKSVRTARGGALRRVARGDQLHQPREVVRAARRRQRPHVLEPEVAGELVDPPGPGGVRGVREPHSGSRIDRSGRVLTTSAAVAQPRRAVCDRERHVPEPAHRVRVGRADDLHAGSQRVADVLAAEVEAVGEAVDLERDPFLERDLEHALEVEGVLRPPVDVAGPSGG